MLALSEFISDSSYKTNLIQSGLFKLFNVASVWTIAKRSFQKCSVNKTWICENLLHKFCCLETGLLVTATFRNFIKKRLQHRCFPVNIGKFLRKPILENICEQLEQLVKNIHHSNRCYNSFRLEVCNFTKKTLRQVFSRDYCEDFRTAIFQLISSQFLSLIRINYW